MQIAEVSNLPGVSEYREAALNVPADVPYQTIDLFLFELSGIGLSMRDQCLYLASWDIEAAAS